jgi:hypothetical protein
MQATNGYPQEFRIQVVDRFLEYFAVSSVLSAAARSTSDEFHVASSTVLKWAEAQGRIPVPTWGEIRRLRAEVAHLRHRLELTEEKS